MCEYSTSTFVPKFQIEELTPHPHSFYQIGSHNTPQSLPPWQSCEEESTLYSSAPQFGSLRLDLHLDTIQATSLPPLQRLPSTYSYPNYVDDHFASSGPEFTIHSDCDTPVKDCLESTEQRDNALLTHNLELLSSMKECTEEDDELQQVQVVSLEATIMTPMIGNDISLLSIQSPIEEDFKCWSSSELEKMPANDVEWFQSGQTIPASKFSFCCNNVGKFNFNCTNGCSAIDTDREDYEISDTFGACETILLSGIRWPHMGQLHSAQASSPNRRVTSTTVEEEVKCAQVTVKYNTQVGQFGDFEGNPSYPNKLMLKLKKKKKKKKQKWPMRKLKFIHLRQPVRALGDSKTALSSQVIGRMHKRPCFLPQLHKLPRYSHRKYGFDQIVMSVLKENKYGYAATLWNDNFGRLNIAQTLLCGAFNIGSEHTAINSAFLNNHIGQVELFTGNTLEEFKLNSIMVLYKTWERWKSRFVIPIVVELVCDKELELFPTTINLWDEMNMCPVDFSLHAYDVIDVLQNSEGEWKVYPHYKFTRVMMNKYRESTVKFSKSEVFGFDELEEEELFNGFWDFLMPKFISPSNMDGAMISVASNLLRKFVVSLTLSSKFMGADDKFLTLTKPQMQIFKSSSMQLGEDNIKYMEKTLKTDGHFGVVVAAPLDRSTHGENNQTSFDHIAVGIIPLCDGPHSTIALVHYCFAKNYFGPLIHMLEFLLNYLSPYELIRFWFCNTRQSSHLMWRKLDVDGFVAEHDRWDSSLRDFSTVHSLHTRALLLNGFIKKKILHLKNIMDFLKDCSPLDKMKLFFPCIEAFSTCKDDRILQYCALNILLGDFGTLWVEKKLALHLFYIKMSICLQTSFSFQEVSTLFKFCFSVTELLYVLWLNSLLAHIYFLDETQKSEPCHFSIWDLHLFAKMSTSHLSYWLSEKMVLTPTGVLEWVLTVYTIQLRLVDQHTFYPMCGNEAHRTGFLVAKSIKHFGIITRCQALSSLNWFNYKCGIQVTLASLQDFVTSYVRVSTCFFIEYGIHLSCTALLLHMASFGNTIQQILTPTITMSLLSVTMMIMYTSKPHIVLCLGMRTCLL